MALKRQPSIRSTKQSPLTAQLPRTTSVSRKRKADEVTEEVSEKITRVPKRQKEEALVLNTAPAKRLDIYVFGTNCYGELGLGDATKKSEIPGPVLNPKLSADTAGVVHIAIGGVHSAALTHDNKILTWGVNDEGTLGRDTHEEKPKIEQTNGQTNGVDHSDSEDEDEVTLNLKEATPKPVDPAHFPDGTVFTQLVATDSATFALTREGSVYGWGTFRGASGVIGFSPDTEIQRSPILIPGIEKVIKLVSGAQHVLALTSIGTVFSWGCAEQNQLGRRILGRLHKSQSLNLKPGQCALPSDVVDLGAGSYHSFAIRKNGHVYGWGSNNFGQTGVPMSAGESDAVVIFPTEIRSLRQHGNISSVAGGKDHSLTVTKQGRCLIWGRIDNKALGLSADEMPSSNIVIDEYGRPRILTAPTPITSINGEVVFATASSDHSFAITRTGQGYSWGFNVQSQAGHPGIEEVERPTLLQNKHVNGKTLVAAAAGGQFSMVLGEYKPAPVDA